MTSISQDGVLHLAQLSNLQLSDDEISNLQEDLANILTYVEQLKEVNTKGVEPTYQVTDLENIMREDIHTKEQLSPDELIALVPEKINHQIKVPKVL